MPVSLQSVPTTNSTHVTLQLLGAGGAGVVATLAPGAAQTLTVSFNTVVVLNPPAVPVARNQNPAAVVNVQPGNIAFFVPLPGGVRLRYAQPEQAEAVVDFL